MQTLPAPIRVRPGQETDVDVVTAMLGGNAPAGDFWAAVDPDHPGIMLGCATLEPLHDADVTAMLIAHGVPLPFSTGQLTLTVDPDEHPELWRALASDAIHASRRDGMKTITRVPSFSPVGRSHEWGRIGGYDTPNGHVSVILHG